MACAMEAASDCVNETWWCVVLVVERALEDMVKKVHRKMCGCLI